MLVLLKFVLFLALPNLSSAAQCAPGEPPKGEAWLPLGRVAIMYGTYWCGSGYMGRQSCWRNGLDAICQAHDFCEMKNVRKRLPAHSCDCDIDFIKKASAYSSMGWIMARGLRLRNTTECLRKLK